VVSVHRRPTARVGWRPTRAVLRILDPDHAKVLATLARMDAPASIESTKDSREVSAVGSSPCDVVLVIAMESAQAQVQLLLRPTLVSLDRSHPLFAGLLELLEGSLHARTIVHIGVLPGGSRIEDVRPVR
jgi:hypothetical protein